MNIFVLSRNVRTCARMHCDRHAVKMPVETAQLLSGALYSADPERWRELHVAGLAYLPSHASHPCALWTRECINNYLWLAALGLELCKEYSYRYGRKSGRQPARPETDAAGGLPPAPTDPRTATVTPPPRRHKSEAVISALLATRPPLPRRRCITPFALVMPEDCVIPGDPVSSYRNYYVRYKSHIAHWTGREVPGWFPLAPTPP